MRLLGNQCSSIDGKARQMLAVGIGSTTVIGGTGMTRCLDSHRTTW